jgi:hypothetical protein
MILATFAALLVSSQQAEEPYYLNEEEEFYPANFRGKWAPTVADCKSDDAVNVIVIGRTKIWAYEADSKLLKLTPMSFTQTPEGVSATSITAMVAERGESELDIGKIRLTRAGDKLFTSRANAVSEDHQWRNANVRCP